MSSAKPRLYRTAFSNITYRAEIATAGFLNGLQQFHSALLAYEPKVALLLMGKARSKGGSITSSFLTPMRFELVPTEQSVFAIGYTAPSKQLLDYNFEHTYKAVAEACWPRQLEMSLGWAMKYSPTDVLLDMVQSNLIEGVVQADRLDQLKELHYPLETQLPTVTRACDRLRQFVMENFALTDLLHVNVERTSEF